VAFAAPVAAAAARGAAARGAAGAAAKRGAGKAAAGKATAGKVTTAAEQASAIQAIKDARPKEPEPAPVVDEDQGDVEQKNSSGGRRELPGVLTDQRGAPAAFRIDGLRTANAGGGFVLGMFAYVVGLTYLRDGKAGVKRLLRAKFFNEVGP
jgi:hypothetical protein